MPQSNPPSSKRKFLRARRLALLASAAGLGLAVVAAAPSAYRDFDLAPISAAPAADAACASGFADLVAKVNPPSSRSASASNGPPTLTA